MGLGYDLVKQWARNNKVEVCEVAQRFSGSFVITLTQCFARADMLNTEKILSTWEAEFKNLYQLSGREQHNMDKAEHDAQEDNNPCTNAIYPWCNGAEGCDTCPDNPVEAE